MSRNFDLLRNLGKDLDLLEYSPVADPRAQVTTQSAPAKPPEFDMEPAQRDEVMKLVQRVFLTGGSEAARVVTFCGIDLGGDSGWMCSRAAEVLASLVAGSVCVVDANLREPGLHRFFGVEDAGTGLTNALQQNDPINSLVRRIHENLWLLSSGDQAEEWTSLLGSDRTRARIQELRAEFDYVLIDAPAANPGNDVISLGKSSDGVVMVLKANESRKEVARKAVKDLGNSGVKVLGAVLNNRTFPIPDRIYRRL
jgi:Mrp family chromosome partitioning ATPase